MAQSSPQARKAGRRRRLKGLAAQHSAPAPNRYTPSAESAGGFIEIEVDEAATLTVGIVHGADVIPARTREVLDEMHRRGELDGEPAQHARPAHGHTNGSGDNGDQQRTEGSS
jgi:hypothetical protein